ncbi:Conserved hypothetical protein CHP02231 [Aphelenchoides avenae]|nr:Conserved hypothetical protein CHP02231 [Aphelenchus avenae]
MTTTNAAKSFEARDLHLKAVTVFTDRAEVVREFSVELEQGLTDVIVNNVAATLDSRSIQVSASGTTIQKVEFKKGNAKGTQEDSSKVKRLLEEDKTLVSNLASKKDLKETYRAHLEALHNIVTSVPLHTDYTVMGRTFGSLGELFSFHAEEASKVNVLLRGIDAEIADLESKAKGLQEEISKTYRSEAKQKSIVITLESATKATVHMELTYQVHRACWSPNYDLHVTSDPKSPTKKHAKLHYFANIQQASGEDWKDAEIELSTAEPRRAGSVPQRETLNAKLRRRVEPRYDDDGTLVEQGAKKTGSRPGASELDSDEPTKFNEMRVQKHALSSTFKVPQKISIPGDSSEHKVTVACLEFELLVGLECFPYVTTDVFETASALNNSNYPLLRGPAAVYLDQKFTSDTTIHAAAIDEKFIFALGVNSDVKVKCAFAEPYRKQSEDEETSTSLFDKRILVKNLKTKEKVQVTIHLQLPKSTDSKIEIDLLEPAKSELVAAEDANTLKPPAIGPCLSGDNILDWTLELDAGKERELAVKWSVQAPADETVEYYTQGLTANRSNE